MTYLHPSWQLSATSAVLLTVLWGLLTLTSRNRATELLRSFAREFAVVMTLLGIWQYVGRFVRTHVDGAYSHAVWVQNAQRFLHLPDELELQHLVLPHEWLVRGMNSYYAFAHLNGMALFLVWVWWRRRDDFRAVRNTVVGTTLICLFVQAIPVAPPRLLPNSGYVDTALLYGQSVYGEYATGVASQLTAMPSVHVAWAAVVGWYVTRLGRGPLRWTGAAHLVITVLVVAATANHWWLDGIVATGIMLAVLTGQWLVSRVWGRLRTMDDEEPEPSPAVV
ncbi:phosphatase PAP2 family protein [Kineosporia sp. J2-2]|uniref:Phosphatase PAP2 family protein n=1 Tax=Kineosporia corallincola TaxID=2835133 RepID=A0ABS5TQS4_9ACTN|nr:phosphatase PAP2 family protein [Kineosporia corallincola]MBT0772179.1 phosphatase PAP2 family protein [Kineosporia corallincola]